MSYRYIKNLRDTKAVKATRLDNIAKTKPTFASKADYRAWCANAATDHVFFNMVEGSTPSKRISNDNLPNKIYGVVADYDAPVNWGSIDTDISAKCSSNMPTWRTKTNSGYLRLIWEFDNALPIAPEMFDAFMKHLNTALKLERLFAGFDSTSLRPSQYFELGEDWTNMGGKISDQTVQTALMKAANEKPPQSSDTSIPIDIIAAEVLARFPNRWIGEFEVGSRGPLFWLDDGIDRDGCQVAEDGMICYSDRAGKGFVTWREIFGGKFVKEYEEKKMGNLLDEYWFNGRSFFKLLFESAVSIPKEQLALELRQMGFSIKLKKGQALSELEAATLTISNQNRIGQRVNIVFDLCII